jgi:arylsulfatase
MGDTLYGVKWQNFKMVMRLQKTLTDPSLKLMTPHIINLIVDPKERKPYDFPYMHSWTGVHFAKILRAYEDSIGREPLIPAGAALNYVPTRKS